MTALTIAHLTADSDKGTLSVILRVRINENAYLKPLGSIKFCQQGILIDIEELFMTKNVVKEGPGSLPSSDPTGKARGAASSDPYWVEMDARKAEEAQRSAPDSLQQPAWHVVVLGVVTFGLYLVYWAYKNWRDLEQKNAVGKALLCIVPIVNLYMFTTLTLSIAERVPDEASFPRQRPLVAALAIVGSYVAIASLSHLQGGWFLLSLLSVGAFAVAQHWLNQYFASVESPELMVRHAFTVKELLVIIFGAMALGLVGSGLMMGVKL
jgi:hypothetical protein